MNPRSAATIESLSAWYDNKLSSLSSLTAAHAGDASAGESHISATRDVWAGVASAISTLEKSIKGPYALGDQISLADIHLIAWLARVITVASGLPGANPKGEGEEIDNLEKALRHSVLGSHPTAGAGVGPKVSRPSQQDWKLDAIPKIHS